MEVAPFFLFCSLSDWREIYKNLPGTGHITKKALNFQRLCAPELGLEPRTL